MERPAVTLVLMTTNQGPYLAESLDSADSADSKVEKTQA